MVRISFKFIRALADRLLKEHDGETALDAAADAASSAAQSALLTQAGKLAAGPLLELAVNTLDLVGGAAIKEIKADLRESARLEKIKQKRLKEMSPAERRRLERIARSGIAATDTPEGFGESWDIGARRAEIAERRKQQRAAKHIVIGAATVSIAGKTLKGWMRGLTAGTAGVAAFSNAGALGGALGVAALATPVGAIALGAATLIGTAVVAHKLVHFATGSKDDLLSPLFDYAITRMLYSNVLLKQGGESSALRQMKDRYAKIGRGICTIPQRFVQGIRKILPLPAQSTRRMPGARYDVLPKATPKVRTNQRRVLANTGVAFT